MKRTFQKISQLVLRITTVETFLFVRALLIGDERPQRRFLFAFAASLPLPRSLQDPQSPGVVELGVAHLDALQLQPLFQLQVDLTRLLDFV